MRTLAVKGINWYGDDERVLANNRYGHDEHGEPAVRRAAEYQLLWSGQEITSARKGLHRVGLAVKE